MSETCRHGGGAVSYGSVGPAGVWALAAANLAEPTNLRE